MPFYIFTCNLLYRYSITLRYFELFITVFFMWLGDHNYQRAFQKPQCITLATKCGFGLVHVENFSVRVG